MKWVLRNKTLAASLAAGVVALGLATGVMGGSRVKIERHHQKEAATTKGLSALQDLEDLLARADKLWPAHPNNIGAFEEWMGNARKLVAELPVHRAKLAEVRSKALQQSNAEHEATVADSGEDAAKVVGAELARLDKVSDELADEGSGYRDGQSPEAEREARWWNNQLTKQIGGLEELERGLLGADVTTEDRGWSIPKRLAFARSLQEGFAEDGEYSRIWSQALPAIRAAYPELALSPQLGLVPIGPDPKSGLWEFAHLQTGEISERDEGGELLLTELTGLVLVPGGTFLMGAQESDPNGANHDPQAEIDEGPVHAVTLSAFFMSKYELRDDARSMAAPHGSQSEQRRSAPAPGRLSVAVASGGEPELVDLLGDARARRPGPANGSAMGIRGKSGDDERLADRERERVPDRHGQPHGLGLAWLAGRPQRRLAGPGLPEPLASGPLLGQRVRASRSHRERRGVVPGRRRCLPARTGERPCRRPSWIPLGAARRLLPLCRFTVPLGDTPWHPVRCDSPHYRRAPR